MSSCGYEFWIGEVRGGQMKKDKEVEEETCIYLSEMCLVYQYIYGRAGGLNTENPITHLRWRESFRRQCCSPPRTVF